mmetsp:Transcript_28686/g.35533  ORF Transcript_28686/g.35533 Transcript_28686/m.35533 type:complete len:128 (-) Transcript_28686:467-850(-)|eukprot:CAMPEP_0170474032 /NCGR_PEP_ID=MMETSP0123-20130129/15859_1 /TAXON_ID=182087 /ORGANISM="Favella ehrenbergii, Strain Fehren 1" /LENGTH=127 /DNA_ID=CAMNT_0010743489 /DNA_START=1938 /DNA_END=2321 /DNA_ORIENTATION=-
MGSDFTAHSSEENPFKNSATPAGQSGGQITRPSTQYNHESKIQFINEGYTCFGNPTLETLKLQKKLPMLDYNLLQQQPQKKKSGVKSLMKMNTLNLKRPHTREISEGEHIKGAMAAANARTLPSQTE